jgi:uncharacterized protein YdcH (DUF465 family)
MQVELVSKLKKKIRALLKIVKRIQELDDRIAREEAAWDRASRAYESLEAKKAKRLQTGSGTVRELAKIEEGIVGCRELNRIAQYEYGKNCSERRAAIAAAWSLQQEIGKIGRKCSEWEGDVKSYRKEMREI